MRRYFLSVFLLVFAAGPAAASLQYYQDPVYEMLGADDHHPMEEIVTLAEEGDVRAQFILGDMYAKGKGGFVKDTAQAQAWFEKAAMHGYAHSFIRLAALSKHANQPEEAWKWYTLAIKEMDYGDLRSYVIRARRELIEKTGFSNTDLSQARQAMNSWEKTRSDTLRAEREAEKKIASADERGAETSQQQEKSHEQD